MSSLLPSSSPAWLAPVWDERSHSQGTIRCVPAIQPAGHRRRVSLAKGTSQDGLGEAVDLEQDHARYLRSVRVANPARPPSDHPKLAGIVIDAEGGRQQGEADREEEGRRDRLQEAGSGAVDELDRDRDDRRVQHQRTEAEGQDGQRQQDADQDGPEERVEQRHQAGRQQHRTRSSAHRCRAAGRRRPRRSGRRAPRGSASATTAQATRLTLRRGTHRVVSWSMASPGRDAGP